MLSGTVSLNPAVGPKVESSFMDELKKVYDAGFTAAEVAAAKKAYLDSRMVGRSTDGALLALMASHEQLDRPFKWDADLEARRFRRSRWNRSTPRSASTSIRTACRS